MTDPENGGMEDWVQLTEEDIERATRLTRASEATPEVITVTLDDVPPESDEQTENAILAVTAADLSPSGPQPEAEPNINRLEQLMFQLVNVTRRHHLPGWVGTANLTWDPKLAAIARQHSSDMLRRQYVAHVTPEGVTAAQRLRQHHVSYVACGENIGIVYGRAAHSERAIQDIHNAFMRQPRGLTNHRGNLLNPIWTHVGIGISYNPDGALVATQNFVSAPAARLRGQ